MKYKCKETFSFENCCFGDDDAAEEYITVPAASIWEKTDDNFIGGDIHLDSEDGLSWIEISRYRLKKYFEEEVESHGARYILAYSLDDIDELVDEQ